jgi:uncharacterized membrane protein YqjE
MNPASDTEFPPSVDHHGDTGYSRATPPANWREAILALVASRLTLIELEFKQAAHAGVRRAMCAVVAGFCVLFTWALLLGGGIALLAHGSGWPWPWIAIATAALHLLAAICFIRASRPTTTPAFPVTRAEFQKDREWIENLHKNPKSNS